MNQPANDNSSSDEVFGKVVSLGPLRQEFKPDTANLMVGFIIGCLLIVGGLAALAFVGRDIYRTRGKMPLFAEKGNCWAASALFVLVGGVLLAAGPMVIRWARKHLSHRVGVYAEGIFYQFRDIAEKIAWTDIKEFKEEIVWERPPVLKGAAAKLIPKKASHNYAVSRCDGATFTFTPNTIRELESLAAILRAQAKQRGIPWSVTERE